MHAKISLRAGFANARHRARNLSSPGLVSSKPRGDESEGINLLMQSKIDYFNISMTLQRLKFIKSTAKCCILSEFGSPEIEVFLFISEIFSISRQTLINSSKTSKLVTGGGAFGSSRTHMNQNLILRENFLQ